MRPLLLAAVAAAFLATSAPAHAGLLPSMCKDERASQVFLPWLDVMNYVAAPDGGLEAGGSGWTLRGGATVVPGNEPFQVGGAADAHSLSIPAGGSATTAPSCRGLDRPTLRFFARRSTCCRRSATTARWPSASPRSGAASRSTTSTSIRTASTGRRP